MGAVTSLAFAPGGWLLVTGGRDSVLNLWNLRTNAHIKTVPVYEVRTLGCHGLSFASRLLFVPGYKCRDHRKECFFLIPLR